jgi:hypothetical protein
MAAQRKYDLYSDRFRAATYETFAQMREENPVIRQPGLGGEACASSSTTVARRHETT